MHELDGCFLYDIDDLEAVVSETLAGRRAEAELAERLVVEEAERFRECRRAAGDTSTRAGIGHQVHTPGIVGSWRPRDPD